MALFRFTVLVIVTKRTKNIKLQVIKRTLSSEVLKKHFVNVNVESHQQDSKLVR